MAIVISSCSTCNDQTPHRTSGYNPQNKEPDGRVYQVMECKICKTSAKIYFKDNTNEFQENLDAPDDTDSGSAMEFIRTKEGYRIDTSQLPKCPNCQSTGRTSTKIDDPADPPARYDVCCDCGTLLGSIPIQQTPP